MIRSLLFAPGNAPQKLEKVDRFGSDWVIFDLEDAVPTHEKVRARALASRALEVRRSSRLAVRVNAMNSGLLEEDLLAIVHPHLEAVVIPKVDDSRILRDVDLILASAEKRRGLSVGMTRLFAIIETAKGVARCDDIASVGGERLITLIFGSGDLALDLDIEPNETNSELLYARSKIVISARAAGLARPIDGPFFDLHDNDGLARDCERSRRMGFQGRVVVYPPQLQTVLTSYGSVTLGTRLRAQRVVDAFESAVERGIGAIEVDGEFVDSTIYEHARRIVAKANGEGEAL